jgi:hypothetical protein
MQITATLLFLIAIKGEERDWIMMQCNMLLNSRMEFLHAVCNMHMVPEGAEEDVQQLVLRIR